MTFSDNKMRKDPPSDEEIKVILEKNLEAVKKASGALASLSGDKKNKLLFSVAEKINENREKILSANKIDAENAKGVIKDSMIDRLTLTDARIDGIIGSIKKVIALPDPTGTFEGFTRPNGLVIEKRRVPFGVIGIIYESRPNVTVDSAALCIKSGNGVVLRGGKEAINTNIALIGAIKEALRENDIPEECIFLIDSADRRFTLALLRAKGLVDLVIPRGSAGLINFVTENALVPAIETGAGNCHIYVHEDADLDIALNVLINAKTQRPSVCNAAETLVVHERIAAEFLPKAAEKLLDKNVEIRTDEKALPLMDGAVPASEEDFFTEYDDLIIAVKTVSSLEEAIDHINRHNTKHSEAIITRSIEVSDIFSSKIDAACVYTNASTRFTDGEEFGFGAEIGISTGKLHARGPMGLNELTCTKYVIKGNGQTRG